jgi:hypothetical protein
MPETMKGKDFTDIQKGLHGKLHGGIPLENTYMAEGAQGNSGSPAEAKTGASNGGNGGGVSRAGFPDQA